MKKVLLTILVVIVVIGVLAGVGVASFRIGYMKGTANSGNVTTLRRFDNMNPDQMPMYRFGNDFGLRTRPFHSPMMMTGPRFGFRPFPILHLIWNIAVLGLVIWFFYWLFTKSGWRITRDTGAGQVQNSKTDEG